MMIGREFSKPKKHRRRSSVGRSQRVSLLSLLLAIIGLVSSAAGQPGSVSKFWISYLTPPQYSLRSNKKNEQKESEVKLYFLRYGGYKKDRETLNIHLECDETAKKTIERCHDNKDIVTLHLSKRDTFNARIRCVNNPEENVDYIVVQRTGEAVYDVSEIGDEVTAIIPSKHLSSSSRSRDDQPGYWFTKNDSFSIWINREKFHTTRRVKFTYEKSHRRFTTVAFLYANGTIQAFPVPSVDASTTSLKCENMKDASYAMVILEENPLDERVFYRDPEESGGDATFNLVPPHYTPCSPCATEHSPPSYDDPSFDDPPPSYDDPRSYDDSRSHDDPPPSYDEAVSESTAKKPSRIRRLANFLRRPARRLQKRFGW